MATADHWCVNLRLDPRDSAFGLVDWDRGNLTWDWGDVVIVASISTPLCPRTNRNYTTRIINNGWLLKIETYSGTALFAVCNSSRIVVNGILTPPIVHSLTLYPPDLATLPQTRLNG